MQKIKELIIDLKEKDKLNVKNSIQILNKLDYDRSDIFLHIDSDIEYETRTISCRKEPEIIEWIHSNFNLVDNPIFFDIGANIGAYSLVASMFMGKHLKVYAFEPSFPNYNQLNKNIILNECQKCIIPINMALSSVNCLDKFNYSSLDSGAAAHAFGKPVGETGELFNPSHTSLMHSYKLDDLINVFNFEIPNFIKIDVDGIEMKILEGAKDTLSNNAVKGIVVEIIYEKDGEEFIQFLKQFDFNFVSRHKYTGVSPCYNYIFQK